MDHTPHTPQEHNEAVYVEGLGFAEGGPKRNIIRMYANAMGFSLIAFLALQNAVPFLFARLFRLFIPAIRLYHDKFLASDEIIETIGIFSSVVCYLLPFLLFISVLRLPLRAVFPFCKVPLGVLLPSAGLTLMSGVVGASVALFLSLLLGKIGLSPSGPELMLPQNIFSLLLLVLSTALLPAFFEELLFRGAILGSLRRFGDLFALTVSTLLFALLHRNLVQIPNALITGFLLGFLFLRSGSLLVPMFCHFINNLLPVLFQSASVNLSTRAAGALYLAMNAFYLLAGLVSFCWLVSRRATLLRPLRQEGRTAECYKYRSFFSSLPILLVMLFLLGSTALNMLP